jgi:HD-GYP domain-containing protein (c-di-GMP phosphodiesterase class II)
VRLLEATASLSLAADLGFGQPFGDGLSIALLSVAIADATGLDEDERRRSLYLALARHIGCTANADEIAAVADDEIALRAPSALLDLADRKKMLPYVLRHVAAVSPLHRRPLVLARILGAPDLVRESTAAACEAAQALATRLGLGLETVSDLPLYFERWDGKGFPGNAKADDLPRPVQVVQVAEATEAFVRHRGPESAKDAIRERGGTLLAPAPVSALLGRYDELVALLDTPEPWEAVLELEPEPWPTLDDDGLDRVLEVFADYADLRSVWLGGHSRAVSALGERAAATAGLPEGDVTLVRRAGLVHDIGRVATSAAVWGKTNRLTGAEREAVRLHPYYTERVLARPAGLRVMGQLASLHHERLDGSGYHRGCLGREQTSPARILAAADFVRTRREARPYRAAASADEAAAAAREEVRAGRLDADAVDAVLSAAGDGRQRRRRGAGELTPREVEVTRLLARGRTKPQIARQLTLAPKTVDAHAQHIYAKLGVSTRAGLTLYAMQQGLLDNVE